MIDKDGNIKLADFGISKSLKNHELDLDGNLDISRTTTMIGTAQYMPPEVFNQSRGGYDQSFDIWSLGCVLYEMVVGEPPFGGQQEQMTSMQGILARNELRMKDYFSNEFKGLLYGILNKDPDRRMKIPEIQKHSFFKKIDWNAMEKKIGLKPPIKPKV